MEWLLMAHWQAPTRRAVRAQAQAGKNAGEAVRYRATPE